MEEEKEEKRKKTRHNIRREATRTMRAESVVGGVKWVREREE